MANDRQKSSSDPVYKEDIRVDFEHELQEMVTNLWGAPRNIDWDAELSVTDTERQILVNLATQFHYNNMSELSLCGRIIERDHLIEAKMIASLIAVSKIRNIGTWGKYLSRLEAVSDVPPPEKDYFGKLQTVDNTVSLLLGMSVIGKVTWDSLADRFDDVGDPVFQQIIEQIRVQKRAKLKFTKEYLTDAISQMRGDNLSDIEADARYYRGHARETILYHGNLLDEHGKNTQAIADHVENRINEFYEDIGITV